MNACAVLIDEQRHNNGRDEWKLLMIEGQIQGWRQHEVFENFDAWWDNSPFSYVLLEQAYYKKHGLNETTETKWLLLESDELKLFLFETIFSTTNKNINLDADWLDFHTNEVLKNECINRSK